MRTPGSPNPTCPLCDGEGVVMKCAVVGAACPEYCDGRDIPCPCTDGDDAWCRELAGLPAIQDDREAGE